MGKPSRRGQGNPPRRAPRRNRAPRTRALWRAEIPLHTQPWSNDPSVQAPRTADRRNHIRRPPTERRDALPAPYWESRMPQDAAYFRGEAERCRRLATDLAGDYVSDRLREWADEYEAKAAEIEARAPP